MTATVDRRNQLLGRLFTEDRSEPGPVKYIVNPGCEAEAAATWKDHGVCPDCSLRAISVGRCVQCGWESEGVLARKAQLAKDGKCVRCGGHQGRPVDNEVSTPQMVEALEVPLGTKVCDPCLFSILD